MMDSKKSELLVWNLLCSAGSNLIQLETANKKPACGGDADGRGHRDRQGLCASSMNGELKWEMGPISFAL